MACKILETLRSSPESCLIISPFFGHTIVHTGNQCSFKVWSLSGFVIFGLIVIAKCFFAEAGLTHGPLVGAVKPTAVKVWVRTSEPASVQIEYSTSPQFNGSLFSTMVTTTQERDLTGTAQLSELEAETQYFYRVWINGAALPEVYQVKTKPWDWEERTFSFAVLSDFSKDSAPVYATVAQESPAFVIFLGDFDHRNPSTLKGMRQMHRALRGEETPAGLDFKTYISQFPFYHVWDDHDFGANDSDKTFPGKPDALKAFREYFPTPTLPSPDGIWHRFRYAQAEFFMLDLRSQRDPNTTPDGPAKSILGTEQKTWLKEMLLNSTAQWKFLMTTVPFNAGSKPSDSWAAFQTERTEIINFIHANEIGGIIIISGDLHSGGAFDDGTNSEFPELSIPHANMDPSQCWAATIPGIWSGGILCGIGRPGYGFVTVMPDRVLLQVKGIDGDIRLSSLLSHN